MLQRKPAIRRNLQHGELAVARSNQVSWIPINRAHFRPDFSGEEFIVAAIAPGLKLFHVDAVSADEWLDQNPRYAG